MVQLKDPALPPGAIVATHEEDGSLEEGQVRRNDGVVLDPASKNPWYVLATVAGEQSGTSVFKIDHNLRIKNRRYWHGWMCRHFSDEEKATLAAKLEVELDELNPLSEEEKGILYERFSKVFPDVGQDEIVPSPADDVDMSSTYFPSALDMSKFYFDGRVSFDAASFKGAAVFEASHFAWRVDFVDVFFAEDAFFQRAHFAGFAMFHSAYFSHLAVFSDGECKSVTDFSQAKFTNHVPFFFHREIYQDTSFSDNAKLWPDVTEKNAKQSKRAYTRLRQIAADIYDPDLEHFFLRQEMRCKERIELGKKDWFHAGMFRLFRWVADHGISVTRPFWLMVCVWAFGAGCAAGYFDSGAEAVSSTDLQDNRYLSAAGLSFGNLFGFLGINRLYFADMLRAAPDGLQFVAGLQTVLGVVLLFFFGLGLRNRFRLK
ncbi:pentapeptide repeat-containing protein [Roseovarius sp. SK2]|uniref:pentapeptide repeat-containing protein n=1 Tax=Roseovarius TaxID=74030 RepID=UPI00237B510A|nr:pentapeptide repeat-containing protein [Roseovarius sp. SK2]MDD9727393.1 pentapeptide repeat-containing protein [Roseovarius sp. SK2]